MGAETEFSPPPAPEPTLSPEPDVRGHDGNRMQQSWKVDMMSALGESVSFGRFLAEPLDWGKRSAFAHNRYLEEAARQSCPGSVAQKKALFEAYYARKSRMEADAASEAAEGGFGEEEDDLAAEDDEGGAATSSSSAAGSSCMTDESAAEQEVSLAAGDGGLAGVAAEEAQAVIDGIDSACNMDEAVANGTRNTEESDVLQSLAKQDSRNGHLVSPDNAEEERQPLKESSIVNQGATDSAKKRRLQMPSLFQKPSKLGSPSSSGKKGQSSSVKRRSALHSSKENASPPGTDSGKRSASPVPRQRSALTALHMSMSFSRCETGNAASCSRNLGITIAERISQLQSASRPVETSQPPEFRSPRKVVMSEPLPEIAPRISQVDKQRSSHVMRVKQMLFGSTSPSVTQKAGINIEKKRFCFKTRPLPNFCWKNKQAKDSKQERFSGSDSR